MGFRGLGFGGFGGSGGSKGTPKYAQNRLEALWRFIRPTNYGGY